MGEAAVPRRARRGRASDRRPRAAQRAIAVAASRRAQPDAVEPPDRARGRRARPADRLAVACRSVLALRPRVARGDADAACGGLEAVAAADRRRARRTRRRNGLRRRCRAGRLAVGLWVAPWVIVQSNAKHLRSPFLGLPKHSALLPTAGAPRWNRTRARGPASARRDRPPSSPAGRRDHRRVRRGGGRRRAALRRRLRIQARREYRLPPARGSAAKALPEGRLPLQRELLVPRRDGRRVACCGGTSSTASACSAWWSAASVR